jgi:hypothetical protein
MPASHSSLLSYAIEFPSTTSSISALPLAQVVLVAAPHADRRVRYLEPPIINKGRPGNPLVRPKEAQYRVIMSRHCSYTTHIFVHCFHLVLQYNASRLCRRCDIPAQLSNWRRLRARMLDLGKRIRRLRQIHRPPVPNQLQHSSTPRCIELANVTLHLLNAKLLCKPPIRRPSRLKATHVRSVLPQLVKRSMGRTARSPVLGCAWGTHRFPGCLVRRTGLLASREILAPIESPEGSVPQHKPPAARRTRNALLAVPANSPRSGSEIRQRRITQLGCLRSRVWHLLFRPSLPAHSPWHTIGRTLLTATPRRS